MQLVDWGLLPIRLGPILFQPTRFLFNLPGVDKVVRDGWPAFDKDGIYLGPLEQGEPFQSLIGKDGQVFQTAAFAAWPSLLCSRAELIVEVTKRRPPRQEGELSAIGEGQQEGGACEAGPVPAAGIGPTSHPQGVSVRRKLAAEDFRELQRHGVWGDDVWIGRDSPSLGFAVFEVGKSFRDMQRVELRRGDVQV